MPTTGTRELNCVILESAHLACIFRPLSAQCDTILLSMPLIGVANRLDLHSRHLCHKKARIIELGEKSKCNSLVELAPRSCPNQAELQDLDRGLSCITWQLHLHNLHEPIVRWLNKSKCSSTTHYSFLVILPHDRVGSARAVGLSACPSVWV